MPAHRTIFASSLLPLCFLPSLVIAQSTSPPPDNAASDDRDPALETVTVVGTRTERRLSEVEATISVYGREDIDRWLVRDIQDLIRFEPGVSVAGGGSRFGLEGFTIRGIGGNRVLTLVDGIRMPEEFSFGPFLSARRDFVDVDTISRVEIARGPSSTLYGSDALGGVVSVTTRAPNEYVSAEEPLYLDTKAGYSSEDNSVMGSLNAAYGTERVAGLITYTQRSAEETQTAGDIGGFGSGRSKADPQAIDTRSFGAKLAVSPFEGHNLIFALDLLDADVDTTLLSDFGEVARGIVTDARNAQDQRERSRYSLSYRYDSASGLLNNAQVTVYRQTSETQQLTLDERTSPRLGALTRERLSTFEQQIDGLFAQASRSARAFGAEHTLTFGVDWYRTDNANLRDGGTVSAVTGAVVPEFAPLPTRDFPPTEVENRALFLQDEMVFLEGRLRITPGLRYDDYSASTRPDDLYFNGNPGVPAPEDFDDSDLTLKLGALYQFTPAIAGWARYSEGFRAPPYDDVNVGFSNFLGGYKTIAAPDLASESSTGYEVGLRFNNRWGQAQLAAFTTRYDNFIEANVIAPGFATSGGIDPADGLLTFQSVNRGAVDIEGIEFRGQLALGALSPALAAFSLEGAAAYASGESSENIPINTVDPLSTVLGLRWAPTQSAWSSELIWSWSADKDSSDIDGDRFATDSFHLLDLLVHADLSDRISIDLGVFNLLDERYIRWADTAGIGEDNPMRFSRPGRNVSINLRAVW
ncbi:TonB-dependent hemoglobin/transferrin/lactoferrin family receptor [Chromatocurvus halotolerans]|uniref:Hemoglobin/transferrin/lactoferrin receptor protein n=1 Tax=Chromatocurvus halotolerans TaxID=1132028 RepID=A0A4R2KWU7_9GAMM|nr:TonB-dependent hemoglobin/transferrin/lactoferrin family receptor [Chromatocurvus halotolerans]TCO78464.1 hemoglobin/transferrin/lactoferrin receptor protein [Chromatocurvus halotolerans]